MKLRRVLPLPLIGLTLLLAACGGGEQGGHGGNSVQDPADTRASALSEQATAWLGTVGEAVDEALSDEPAWQRAQLLKGQLPPGLRLQGTRMVGTPTETGRFNASLQLEDASGRASVIEVEWVVETASAPEAAAPGTALGTSGDPQSRQRALSKDQDAAPDLSNLLAIVRGLPEGGWAKVNLNSYSEVWTPADLRTLYRSSNPTPEKILRAWSSMAWDSKRARFWLYGGGHANYSGNDTYYFDASTQRWVRASLPSQMVQDAKGRNAPIDGIDKAPPSAHTYDNTAYLPIADRHLVLGGAADPNGGHYLTLNADGTDRKTGPYLFDPARADGNKVGGSTGSHVQRVAPYPEIVGGNMWDNRESWLHANANSAPPSESFVNGCAAVAESGGKDIVYVRTAYRVYRYTVNDVNNPSADTWTRAGRYYSGSGSQTSCSYDAARKILVALGKTTIPFVYWNMNTEGASNNEVRFTPADPSGEFNSLIANAQLDPRYCGIKHDPRRGDHVLWCGDGRTWNIKPPAAMGASGWIVSKNPVPTTSVVPNDGVGAGILGKWKYIAALDAFMGVTNGTHGNVWVYKPVGWVDPDGNSNSLPSVQLSAPAAGASATVGQTVPLVASASDSDGSIARVEFYADGVKLGEVTQAPYQMDWLAGPVGTVTLSVKAIDNVGASRSASTSFTVLAQMPTNQPPSVSLSSPLDASHSTQGQTITLTAAAADSDGSVAAVEFYDGSTMLARVETAPFTWSWNGAGPGAHVITAKAFDDQGASTVSTPVTHTVDVGGGSGDTVTVTLQRGALNSVVADTYLTSYGVNSILGATVNTLDQSARYTTLLQFRVFQSEGGPVPDGATIVSAQLSVYKYSAYDMVYALHPMLVSWSESGSSWNQRAPGSPWGSAGANGVGVDYAAVADAVASAGFSAGWLQFELTDAVAARAAAPLANRPFGWRLLPVSGYISGLKKFHTSEAVADPALRPKLVVTYR